MKQIEGAIAAGLGVEFAIAMISLYVQSGLQPKEVVQVLQSHATQHEIDVDRFPISEFHVALEHRYSLSTEQVSSIFKFINPEDSSTLSIRSLQELLVETSALSIFINESINMSCSQVLYSILQGLEQHCDRLRSSFTSKLLAAAPNLSDSTYQELSHHLKTQLPYLQEHEVLQIYKRLMLEKAHNHGSDFDVVDKAIFDTCEGMNILGYLMY